MAAAHETGGILVIYTFIAQATDTTSAAPTDIWTGWYLVYGFAIVAVLGILQLHRQFRNRKAPISITFARLYGLLVVGTLGMVIMFAPGSTESKAPAYTLLGTVAGYLAGAPSRRESQAGTDPDDSSSGGGDPDASRGSGGGGLGIEFGSRVIESQAQEEAYL